MACPLAAERIWVEKSRYHDAEKEYYERLAKPKPKVIIRINYKLLKGQVSATQIDSLPSNANSLKSKYRTRKISRKSKSPETMPENEEAVAAAVKLTPNNCVAKSKKQKKTKGADSEVSSTNSISNDISTNLTQETSQNIIAVEETKPKKKKKKKTNKDTVEKLHDLSQKENVPPTLTIAAKKDSLESTEKLKSLKNKGSSGSQCTLVSEIAKARQHIKNSLEKMDGIATLAASPASPDVLDRLAAVEKDNADLRKLIESLKNVCIQSENRVKSLEQKLAAVKINAGKPTVSVKPVPPSTENNADDDDGVDLFASDSDEEESAEAAKIREERLAAYAAKKSKKPVIIAKSSIVLDVKPWDDETDMSAMEAEVRKIVLDGMLWGASKYVPVAFGIKKLSISCVVEDDKVSVDGLIEEIEKLEDYVQSVDVAAFNKI